MTVKIDTELILMIKVLWNTISEPENDPREKEMTQSRSLHNARVCYSPMGKKNKIVRFRKEYRQKSTLCHLPVWGKEKDHWLQPEYKQLQRKTPAQYNKSVSAKKKKNHIGLQTEHMCDNTNFILKFLYIQLAEKNWWN